ncbi:MAG: DUF4136 domain-containing protein [Planctomycetota bacterium]
MRHGKSCLHRPLARPSDALGRGLLFLAVLSSALLSGCDLVLPVQFDGQAIVNARSIVLVPLADAPGADATGSGKLVCGEFMTQLVGMGQYRVSNLTGESFTAAIKQAGYDERDRYDPALAAAIAKQTGADLAVSGELMQYGKKQEYAGRDVLIVVHGGETETYYQVSVSLRLVRAADGKVVYTGTGTGESKEGLPQATSIACTGALKSLKEFLQAPRTQAEQKPAAAGGK